MEKRYLAWAAIVGFLVIIVIAILLRLPLDRKLNDLGDAESQWIVSSIKDSGRLLVFYEDNLEPGILGLYGIKNTFGEERRFLISMTCIEKKLQSSSTPCEMTRYENTATDSYPFEFMMFNPTNIPAGEIKVLPFRLTNTGAKKDNYLFRWDVYAGNDAGEEPLIDPANLYASEEFTVVVE